MTAMPGIDWDPMPPPAPRPFRWRAMGAGGPFALMFGGIWFAVGALIATVFTVAGGPIWNDAILNHRGVAAQATPAGVEMTGARVNHRRVQRITYTFSDGTGTPRFASASTTDGDTIARARAGQPLAIEFDPQAPALTRLAGGSASFFGWFVLFPLGFAVVGAVILGGGLRRLRRVRALYVHGEAVRAQVTAVTPSATRVNGRPVMRVAYSFDTLTGRMTGEGSSKAPPPVGATIWVLFDRSAPRNNLMA